MIFGPTLQYHGFNCFHFKLTVMLNIFGLSPFCRFPSLIKVWIRKTTCGLIIQNKKVPMLMARRFRFLGREAPNAQLNYAILPSFCLDYKFHILNNSNHSCSILLFLSARERKKKYFFARWNFLMVNLYQNFVSGVTPPKATQNESSRSKNKWQLMEFLILIAVAS